MRRHSAGGGPDQRSVAVAALTAPSFSPAPPGARGRIGIIQPAPGVMLEHEWPRWLPDGVLFPVGRMRMPGVDRAAYAAMAAAAPEVARDLARAGCAPIAYACTVGSVYAGVAAEEGLLTTLAEASGRPALSLGAASTAALRAVSAARLLIVTPYTEETNGWVAAYARECGFAVEAVVTTPVDIREIGDWPPARIAAFAVETLAAHPAADALWLPCTAMQTLDAIDGIEAASGRPAVSGSQALLWQALGRLDVPAAGPGRLFA